jgi:hypothetical protein
VLVAGNPKAITAALAQIADDKVKERLVRDDLIAALREMELELKDWADQSESIDDILDNRVADSLRRTARGFAGTIVARRETNELIGLIEAETGSRRVLVTGRGGSGKSTVINEAIQHFRERGWRVFPVVLDDIDRDFLSTEELGKLYGLPSSPVAALASSGEPALLVVDQLDRASMDRGDRAPLAETVARLARQAIAHPQLRVVISCRSDELAADPRLRRLGERDEEGGFDPATIDVGLLDRGDVLQTVTGLGLPASDLSDDQIELLRVPYQLALLAGSPDPALPLDFNSAAELLERFEKVSREKHG